MSLKCTLSLLLPFAFPASLGDRLQRGVEAVRVVADVTVITQQQPSLIAGLATPLTHRTV